MSILTNRELEFLVSLNTDWRRLYWTELARLLVRDCADRATFAAPNNASSRSVIASEAKQSSLLYLNKKVGLLRRLRSSQ